MKGLRVVSRTMNGYNGSGDRVQQDLFSGLDMDLKYEWKQWDDPSVAKLVVYSEKLPVNIIKCGSSRDSVKKEAECDLAAQLLGNCWYSGAFDDDFYADAGYYESPDEKSRSINEILESEYQWYKDLYQIVMGKAKCYYSFDTFMNAFSVSDDKDLEKYIMLPFMHLQSGKSEEIPVQIMEYFGKKRSVFCAPTIKQAVIKGFCHLIASTHSVEIHEKCIVPPEIPEQVWKDNKDIRNVVALMEREGINVQFRDCSLSSGLPVTAAVFIDKKTGCYRIAYAADFCLERSLKKAVYRFLEDNDFANHVIASVDNLGKADVIYNLENDKMVPYHYSFFSGEPSYSYSLQSGDDKLDEDTMYDMVLQHCEKYGLNLYARDISIRGFSGVQLFIPEMCNLKPDISLYIKEKNSYNHVYSFLRNFDFENNGAIENTMVYAKYKEGFSDFNYMSHLIRRPIKKEDSYESYLRFMTGINILNGNYNDFIKLASEYLVRNNEGKNAIILNCMIRYLELYRENTDRESLKSVMTKLYDEDIVKTVDKLLFQKKYTIEKLIFQCNDFSCDKCRYSSICQYADTRKTARLLYRVRAESADSDGMASITDQLPKLTKREEEVLELYIRGTSRKEISDELYIAENTVKRHLSNIFIKFGTSNKQTIFQLWNTMKGVKSNGKQEKYF